MVTLIQVFDFFAGCGGTSKGFEMAGCNIVFALDNNLDATLTFKKNFPDTIVLNKDINRIKIEEIEPLVSGCKGKPLLFCGCAPCQPFTKQKTTKKDRDNRIQLLSEFQRFVKAFKPHYVFVENVPGMQKQVFQSSPFKTFVDYLRNDGYSYEFKVIQSQDYGIPQQRKRLVLIACKTNQISIPKKICDPSKSLKEYSTVREWISDLPPIEAGEEHPTIPNHRSAQLEPINLKRIKSTPEGGNRLNWPKSLWLDCHKDGYKGHTDVYGRMKWDEPATGLTTRCISLSNGRFGHPEQNRAISIREAACLQTFPRDFIFHGNLNSMAKQIGNAVPVKLAEVFGKHMIKHYRNLNGKIQN